MRYKIIRSNWNESPDVSMKELEEKVNEHLASKWKLQGGVCVDGSENGQIFYQAMTTNNMSIKE